MQIIRWLARLASREREGGGEGNKLKRTKWGWYEDDIQIRSRGKWRKYTYVARTLRASRVIGWYSDTKKLSFAFIPASNRGTICSGIKRALQTHGFHIQKRIFLLQSALLLYLSPSPPFPLSQKSHGEIWISLISQLANSLRWPPVIPSLIHGVVWRA